MQIGQIVRGKRVNYRRPRIAALVVLSLGIALGLSRTGTTITNTSNGPKPEAMCPIGDCIGGMGVKGTGHGGGGGTIKVAP